MGLDFWEFGMEKEGYWKWNKLMTIFYFLFHTPYFPNLNL